MRVVGVILMLLGLYGVVQGIVDAAYLEDWFVFCIILALLGFYMAVL